MKRRSFFSGLLLPLLALALPARRKSFLVVLTASEGGEVYTGEGSTISLAMASLRENIENCTCEFDECFAEAFAESAAELEGGARCASHYDFSCPEEAYTIVLTELEGGRVA